MLSKLVLVSNGYCWNIVKHLLLLREATLWLGWKNQPNFHRQTLQLVHERNNIFDCCFNTLIYHVESSEREKLSQCSSHPYWTSFKEINFPTQNKSWVKRMKLCIHVPNFLLWQELLYLIIRLLANFRRQIAKSIYSLSNYKSSTRHQKSHVQDRSILSFHSIWYHLAKEL